jgi:aerobic-type carbon monoxide dehydrogenase small subunit (CoxS/CutS family)
MANVKTLHINGAPRAVDAEPERPLLSVLREDLDLTGAKYGCGEGQCGACTVLVGDTAVRSCITPVGSVGEAKITTVEGLAQEGRLHPLQEAFVETGASLQCSYCASGMLMSAAALLRKESDPSREQIVRAMSGNLCRCGTYPRIVTAISQAAKKAKEARR